jgi:membrane-bound lytic murein transglycosylase D
MNYLPAETRSYVPTYIAAVYVMCNYQDYKLVSAEPKRELYAVDTVLITAKVSLKHICNSLSIPEDELQFLNPSVKTGIIPQTKQGFPLNLPINYFALFEARKNEIMNDTSLFLREYEPVASVSKTIWYKVKKNETISKVASKHGVSVASIKKWNRLKSSSVYYGQKLKIVISTPSPAVSSSYAQAFAPKIIEKTVETPKVVEPVAVIADTTVDSSSITSTRAIELNKDCNCIYYVVQPGDTLWNIAEKYDGVSLDKLKADNRSVVNRPIKAGDILKIFM